MGHRGFCGCCSLQAGGVFTGLLASVYNGAMIYWFILTLQTLHSNDDFFLVLTVVLEVLMSLAAVHIAVSLLLIYAIFKEKPDLVMLWIIVYISSCFVVAGLFTIGVAFMLDKVFLYIILCNFLFLFNVVMTLRLYKDMVGNGKKENV
ncbi:uncharacterized protein LOC124357622 [Homalodisca vitripennis]|uniref:Uncharacterized protein n=1 Tax=Homalodisca liturata TaxID=320908 RepID=A0A1B6HMD9_9HEMI|nr:uncharacterized protein LOC124357622 [Homalodisca vitripennis]XP_046665527.1 uncharacterized protein LOC124357622 [Homalodisca vitripennis]XP_046665528.1 uncharacterized protein LOC124357622 [Homalodisca vitripennis]XP_046665529.1 uncharacterized protein LOC124357622 [Homalodisca vitripennis]XP_046665530.1 uncharacterized protein LOC124357622 [Homalodisca vitripennis]